MRTFSIITLGCKVNQYESQQIRELLEQLGLQQAERAEKSDLVVVNTCCVTGAASARSRQYIRKSRKLNPGAVIVVCGCLPTVQIGEMPAVTENVHVAQNQKDLAQKLSRIVSGKPAAYERGNRQICPNNTIRPETSHKIKSKTNVAGQPNSLLTASLSSNEPKRQKAAASDRPSTNPAPTAPNLLPILSSFEGHTRAFLKVQDGCDEYCSYCIVPKTRPIVRSKAAGVVLTEARALVAAGHKEIVVTGIFLGAYGQVSVRRRNWAHGRNDKLAELLDELAQIPGLERIRLSSLEPGDITEKLLDTFCEHRNIMPHLHLSLQSGSDAVLRKMCRQYDADRFRQVVEAVKARLDRPAITTDIIVGFPGETDADFEKTVGMAREVGFAKMHIFPFSARKGTAAAKMQDLVDARLVKRRSRVMHDLNAELGIEFREQFVGESVEILVEGNGGQTCGRSERYFMVYLDNIGKAVNTNKIVRIRVVANRQDGVAGVCAM